MSAGQIEKYILPKTAIFYLFRTICISAKPKIFFVTDHIITIFIQINEKLELLNKKFGQNFVFKKLKKGSRNAKKIGGPQPHVARGSQFGHACYKVCFLDYFSDLLLSNSVLTKSMGPAKSVLCNRIR